jgi:hypothetical protein
MPTAPCRGGETEAHRAGCLRTGRGFCAVISATDAVGGPWCNKPKARGKPSSLRRLGARRRVQGAGVAAEQRIGRGVGAAEEIDTARLRLHHQVLLRMFEPEYLISINTNPQIE